MTCADEGLACEQREAHGEDACAGTDEEPLDGQAVGEGTEDYHTRGPREAGYHAQDAEGAAEVCGFYGLLEEHRGGRIEHGQ